MSKPSSVFDPAVQHTSVDHKIAAALERLGQVFRGLLWEKATAVSTAHTLSPIQIQFLIFLHFHGPAGNRVGALAREFGITPATVSDAVRVLKKKGLLTKEPAPEDARARLLRLTSEGQRLAGELADWADIVRHHIAAHPEAEKVVVMRFLLDLIASLQHAGVVTVARMCTSCRFFEQNRYDDAAAPHYCRLLDMPLADQDLRVDCPEHELAAADA